ncbi:MAG: hypothetical protein ACRC0L_03000, partial [Angustibacter sp.]
RRWSFPQLWTRGLPRLSTSSAIPNPQQVVQSVIPQVRQLADRPRTVGQLPVGPLVDRAITALTEIGRALPQPPTASPPTTSRISNNQLIHELRDLRDIVPPPVLAPTQRALDAITQASWQANQPISDMRRTPEGQYIPRLPSFIQEAQQRLDPAAPTTALAPQVIRDTEILDRQQRAQLRQAALSDSRPPAIAVIPASLDLGAQWDRLNRVVLAEKAARLLDQLPPQLEVPPSANPRQVAVDLAQAATSWQLVASTPQGPELTAVQLAEFARFLGQKYESVRTDQRDQVDELAHQMRDLTQWQGDLKHFLTLDRVVEQIQELRDRGHPLAQHRELLQRDYT